MAKIVEIKKMHHLELGRMMPIMFLDCGHGFVHTSNLEVGDTVHCSKCSVLNQDTMKTLSPGTYRLTRDVVNPHPDRRVNQDRRTPWQHWATWPAGLILVADRYADGVVRVKARGGIDTFSPWDAGFVAMLAAMEPVSESPSDLLRRMEDSAAGGCALAILDRLLSTEAVAEALRAMEEEDQEGALGQ